MIFSNMTRFTLLIGSRAALLMQSCGKEIEKTWILPHDVEGAKKTLKEACAHKPHFPVKVVIDTAAILLKDCDLPPAAPWVRRRVMLHQNRQHVGAMDMAGAFEFRVEGKPRALHAAANVENALSPVFDVLQGLPNTVEALSFFPVECAFYATQVAVLPLKGWSVLHILTESSGLRQIVMHDEMPLFTRLHDDCLPGLPRDTLLPRLAGHISSLHDFLPRLVQGKPERVIHRLFVPAAFKDVQDESFKALGVQIYALDAPRGEIVPPEWAADVTWLALAARQKEPLLSLVPQWLKQRRASHWKRTLALWVLLFFGSAGVFSGMTILTQSAVSPQTEIPAPPVVVAPAPQAAAELPVPLPEPPAMALDAVMYHAPGDWAVWINGEKYTPDDETKDIQILAVSEREVVVRWAAGAHTKDMVLALKTGAEGAVEP